MKLNIGQKLLKFREDKNLNQSEFADFIGMSTSAYARLERGETQIDLQQLTQIVQKLGISILDFLPENISVHNQNKDGYIGILIGDFSINYYGSDIALLKFQKDQEDIKTENVELKNKLYLLEEEIKKLKKD